jgi:hypothetical protein
VLPWHITKLLRAASKLRLSQGLLAGNVRAGTNALAQLVFGARSSDKNNGASNKSQLFHEFPVPCLNTLPFKRRSADRFI